MSSPRYSQLDDCNVFVKYLPSDLSEDQFHKLFSEFGTIISSKIMVDQSNGKSLGFGFVRFEASESSKKAIKKMNGIQIQNKRLLCKLANQNTTDYTNQILNHQTPSDNLYVKPLLPFTSEDDLRNMFSPFGNIITCKVMIDHKTKKSRQIGFVKFETIDEAKAAMEAMNNFKLDDNNPPLIVKYEDTFEQKIARKSKIKRNVPNTRPIPNASMAPIFMYYPQSPPPMVYMGGMSYPPHPGYEFPYPFSPPPTYMPQYSNNPNQNIPINIGQDSFQSGSPIYPFSWNPEYHPSPYGPGMGSPNLYALNSPDSEDSDIEYNAQDKNDNSEEDYSTFKMDDDVDENRNGYKNNEENDLDNDGESNRFKSKPINIKKNSD
jgi:RNA recognition motif-containing protein